MELRKKMTMWVALMGLLLISIVSIILYSWTGLSRYTDFSPVTKGATNVNKFLPKDHSHAIERMDQPDITEDLYRHMSLTQMNFGHSYILGAVVASSSPNTRLDEIRLFASMDVREPFANNVSCCFRFAGTQEVEYFEIPVNTKRIRLYQEVGLPHKACLYTCKNYRPGIIPDGVGITIKNLSCAENRVTYVHPYVPQFPKSGTTLALCNKGVYGTIKAELITEWMETYRYLGVDKVVAYFFKGLNDNALKVLQYYSAIGFVDLFYLHPAFEDSFNGTYFRNNMGMRNARHVALFDCFERLSGYTYFGLLDHDEFLIPSRNRTLTQFMVDLYKTYPDDAAGFRFKCQHFFLTWAAENGTENDLIIGRHTTREQAPPKSKGPKNIYQTKYIQTGGVDTHKPIPIEGKKFVEVPAEEGFIRHFRDKCYSTSCRGYGTPTKDAWLSTWSNRIKSNVLKVRERIFGSTIPIP